MKKDVFPLALVLALALGPIVAQAAPFLTSNIYNDDATLPTRFLVILDDGLEEQSSAVSVKQISEFTISAYSAATTYKVTIGGFDVTQVGVGGTTGTTAAALAGVLNDSVNAGFTPITWSANGAVVTGTADTAGVSFTPTTSVAAGSGTITAPTEVADADDVYLLYDLSDILFGPHTVSVKAENETATSAAATLTFQVGVDTPEDILIIPSAP